MGVDELTLSSLEMRPTEGRLGYNEGMSVPDGY
jgi:hypothetical protein